MTATVALKDVLRKTLDKLGEEDFKKFKRNLSEKDTMPWGHLEKADKDDIVNLVVERHTEDAGDIVVAALKKTRHDRMAKTLERDLRSCKYFTFSGCS